MNSHISKLRKFLISKCTSLNKQIVSRKRILDAKFILSYLCRLSSTKLSTPVQAADLEYHNKLPVSKQAIEKKLDLLDNKLLNDLFISLVEHINKSGIFTNRHIYAVDGTQISLNKSVDGFQLTKNETYKKALLNTIYSVTNKIPIGFDLSNELDERDSFIKHLLQYVNKNDTIIFDRGYYSQELIKSINDKGCYFICRMKKNSLLLKDIPIDNESYDITMNLENYGKIRIIKYTIKDKPFYLSTNIFDNDITFFKELYHNRWFIEEFFKTMKHDLSLNNIGYKKINRIKQNINMHFIVVLITRYMERLSIKYIKCLNKNYKINHKVALWTTGINILYQLLYKKSNNRIIDALYIINKNTSYSKPNRSFIRKRIVPPSKWYYVYRYFDDV